VSLIHGDVKETYHNNTTNAKKTNDLLIRRCLKQNNDANIHYRQVKTKITSWHRITKRPLTEVRSPSKATYWASIIVSRLC